MDAESDEVDEMMDEGHECERDSSENSVINVTEEI